MNHKGGVLQYLICNMSWQTKDQRTSEDTLIVNFPPLPCLIPGNNNQYITHIKGKGYLKH